VPSALRQSFFVEVVGWTAAGGPADHFHKKEAAAEGGMGKQHFRGREQAGRDF